MPSADVILESATDIANRWRLVAMSWHAVLALAAIALMSGRRPSQRAAGEFLVAPIASVAIIAALAGNPFNAIVFAMLATVLVSSVRSLPEQQVQIEAAPWAAAGVVFMGFGWIYPHFVQTTHWTEYAYAAPLGLVPCPTLAFVIGASLFMPLSASRAWTLTLVAAGLLYGVIGTFGLGVSLDYGLMLGAIVLLGRWLQIRPRPMPATSTPTLARQNGGARPAGA